MTAQMLTVPEVADVLRCSERFVLDELRRKNLRGTKAPGWRVSVTDLDVYIDAKANVSRVRKTA